MATTDTTTERVTFRPPGKRARTIYLGDATVIQSPILGELLTGVELDREGMEVDGKGFDTRRHFISTDTIVNRVPVRMDKTYGEFVDAD